MDTVYPIETALHCLNISTFAYYIVREGLRTLVEKLEWMGDGLDTSYTVLTTPEIAVLTNSATKIQSA